MGISVGISQGKEKRIPVPIPPSSRKAMLCGKRPVPMNLPFFRCRSICTGGGGPESGQQKKSAGTDAKIYFKALFFEKGPFFTVKWPRHPPQLLVDTPPAPPPPLKDFGFSVKTPIAEPHPPASTSTPPPCDRCKAPLLLKKGPFSMKTLSFPVSRILNPDLPLGVSKGEFLLSQ